MNNFFSFLFKSITDFNFYKKAANFKLSIIIKYVLMLVVLASLLVSLGVSLRINKIAKEAGDWTLENLPIITIIDGKASVEAEMPFRIKKEDFEIVIDTTGQVTSLDESVEEGLLLTKDKLYVKQSKVQTNTYDLAQIEELRLDKKTIEGWQKRAVRVLFPIIFIGSFIYYSIAKTLQILFFSIVPLIISGVKNMELKFRQCSKIAAFALSLPFIMASLIEFFYFRVRYFPILFILVYFIFLIRGTLALKEKIQIEGEG